MVAKLMNRNFSAEEFLKSVVSEEDAVEMCKSLQKSLADSDFQLTKWIGSSEKVMGNDLREKGQLI